MHRLIPAVNQEMANRLVTRLAQHIPLPLVFKEQFEWLSSKGGTKSHASPTFSNDLDFQRICRKSVQGLLNDLTSSPQNEALHLQKWLEGFSNRLLNRADGVTAQVQGLLQSTRAVELELHNVFNSFRGLSSSQFVENLVYEEDDSEITKDDMEKPEQGMPSQSYEYDIVPRYKEAVASAWSIYEKHIWKSSTRISGSRTQVPHIIGTEDFMRDNSCGLAEDRSLGFKALDCESDAERDGSAEITEARSLSEDEWLDSEYEVASEQAGGFKPSVSAALDFKAMLEAALRNPYIPQKTDALPSKGTVTQHLNSNLIPTVQGSMASTEIATTMITTGDQIQRNVSKEGHDVLQPGTSLESDSQDQVSGLLKLITQHSEIQKFRNWREPSVEDETTTMISTDVLRDFHTSMMSGGLFDDENEDSDHFASQPANIWLHATRTYGTSGYKEAHIEKHEKERSINDDILVSKLKPSTSPRNPSFPHADEILSKRSHLHEHESLFSHESSGSLRLKATLPFLKKGMFEADDNDPESADIFGLNNGTTNFRKIDVTSFGDSAGKFKNISSSNNNSMDAKALVDEISGRASVARGASYDLGNKAAASSEAGLVIKNLDTESTNCNVEGLSREEFTLSSIESLSETGREVEEVGSVAIARVAAYEKSDLESFHGIADNRNKFLHMKSAHILEEEKVLSAKPDDDMASWSSASSTSDTLNLRNNSAKAFVANESVEPQQQKRNLEVLLKYPTHQMEEVADSIHSILSEFSTNVVEQQPGDESGVVEPPMTKSNFPREKTDEKASNISSNWSRNLNFLQENLSLQCTMSPPKQRRISKTQLSIPADGAIEENTWQNQRPPLQAPSQDTNSPHHTTMSGPRWSKPISTPSLPVTSTPGDLGDTPEGAGCGTTE